MSNLQKDLVHRDHLGQWAARLVRDEIARRDRFVVWLQGPLGAGKTALASQLLHGLGVPDNVPILSPTFTYMTEYKTAEGVLAHMDLYRLAVGDEESVESLLSGRDFRGIIVEWPERAETSEFISPDFVIEIEFTADDDSRLIAMRTVRTS